MDTKEWVQSAFDVLDALNVLRVSAARLNERSHLLRTVWEQGRENALIAAFQEGVPARWAERSRLDLQEQQMTEKTREERKRATTVLREMGKALTAIGEGRTEEIGSQEKEAIAAACRYCLPVFQKLNKDLRKLLETPAWWSASREVRENSMDALARKHSRSVKEVETVVRFLRGSSQRGTATPWQATSELVAEKYGVGAGTVEKIYGDSLKTHPEYRTRKRKILTSQVAERIP